jgi:lipopolysaccharide transport system permease protein
MQHVNRIVIEAGHVEKKYWRDVWRYRELLYFLAWRDVLVRYKQTVIGIAWVVIRPLLVMFVFTLAFGKIAKLPSEGDTPYTMLVLAGLLPWQFFSTALSEASASLISNANLITKVYFPRVIVPVSTVVTSVVDFVVTLGLFAALMVWYGISPTWRLATIPLFVLLMFLAAMGAGLWLAALNVKFRDFRYVVPFIVQFGLYISPVGFSSRIVPESISWAFMLNPMVGVIDGFRWALLGGPASLNLMPRAFSAGVSTLILAAGISYFRRTERSFADVI